MSARRVLLSTPVLLTLLAGALRAGEPAVPADRLLLDWIDGKASFEMFAEFHAGFPRSPHKRDAEELEVAWRCLRSRAELGEERVAALVDGLVGRVADAGGPERGRRIVFVLGRLQDPRALPALIHAAKGGEDEVRAEAVEALGLFGNRRYRDLELVFGGRLWMVVFPPCPDRRATDALREVLDEPEPRWEPEPRAPTLAEHLRRREAFHARRDAWADRRRTALRALEAHDVPEVVDLAVEGRHVDLLAALDSPRTVARLGELARAGARGTRLAAIEALGRTTRREAIPPLLDALLDRGVDDGVRRAARDSLAWLVDGERPDPVPLADGEALRRRWTERLGPDLEHFDEDGARRRHEERHPEPGIYRFGG